MKAKYEPLETYLQSLPTGKEEVSLSFKEIEAIIGASLPASAKSYQAWWANQRSSNNHPQARAWLNAGFRVDGLHQALAGGSVCFKRIKVIQ